MPSVQGLFTAHLIIGFYHSLIDWHHPEFPIDGLMIVPHFIRVLARGEPAAEAAPEGWPCSFRQAACAGWKQACPRKKEKDQHPMRDDVAFREA
jgi:hypothetical protein